MEFTERDAPWPSLLGGPPGRVLAGSEAPVLLVPPQGVDEQLLGDLDPSRWVRLEWAPSETPGLQPEPQSSMNVSVSAVLCEAGPAHADFIRKEVRRSLEWLREGLAEALMLRTGEDDDDERRAAGLDIHDVALDLQNELRDAGLG